MSILKGMLLRFKKNVNERNIKKLKEQNSQRKNFFNRIGTAIGNKCDHYYFNEDEIDLILEELYEIGYTLEKAKYNQFRVSGWSV
ncbi:hypothetical protein CKN63_03300 [Carnobacterium divergens]|uniref:hypothetical protein n=1 Tax=Carnobacterium divergens TaxID=2748 RepID=UPI00107203A4|nr:hypothetical protein [Carnobacterium divergens]TFI67840.1 hypothetical protein CKN59_03260 [Carnobacterium divergens]TFI67886.1 hypothetical protein CKN76_03335 [Carnobacterium divergens]TFI82786.1 hypothetical protein CKN74_03300 [Carnobacterium divergens]TFI93066.1 hypothetical protein CKN61_03200 [Carnobacterium divergens]TFJ08907.1 hypothetical protein CKN75_03330 [Carnobacterium divergens]